MSVLFASDVHLSARRPDRVRAFLEFLDGPCRRADSLYLLGDVFDEWLGDDDRRAPHDEVVDALARLGASGVAVAFAPGNHDFLVGDGFFSATGCEPLTEPARIEVRGTPVVALHGDALCTRDEEYQAWRRVFTDPVHQRRFLELPFEQRIARAATLRQDSDQRTRLKPEDIMDVTPQAVVDLLRERGARHLVHGHTHRPAMHRFDVDGEPALRVVLGDWYEGDQVLLWDDDGPRLLSASTL